MEEKQWRNGLVQARMNGIMNETEWNHKLRSACRMDKFDSLQ